MGKLYSSKKAYRIFACILVLGLGLWAKPCKAQCWEDFSVYSLNGQLCSPGYVTLRAEYYNWNNNYVQGEFRWYTSSSATTPVHTQQIYSDFGQLTSDYSLYASNGTEMWVSFFNYNTYCESYRQSYTFTISPSAYVYQDYAKQCRYETAKIQLSSNVSGVTFQLYKLYEYYDPWYGLVQDYQYEGGNTTGYFELFNFDPVNDRYKYYAKVYQPYGCSVPYYSQLYFDITSASPPSITGNLFVASGSSTTLNASGEASSFNWYNAANNTLVNQGWSYVTPTTLTPGTYTYNVQGTNWDGTCLSDMTSVTLNVTLPVVTYTSLYNSGNFTKTIDVSKPVGTVNGTAGTSPTGAATYAVPIYAPPGTNGHQPSVSLVYNSQAHGGNVGFGWNIGGLSVIGRTGKDIFHDGRVRAISYTSADAFTLDGMRLEPLTGANGADGTLYATEAEGYSKIYSYGGTSADNPSWFKVVAKDGTVMEFGKTTDSRFLSDNGQSVITWRLNRITDISGNYIDFVYENLFRESRIAAINYTGNVNTGLVPYNSIIFSYKARTDKNITYEGGASIVQEALLDNIIVKAEGATTKEYQFNYGFDNSYSLLKEIIEKGSNGTQLNSTIFLYGDQPSTNVSVAQTTALTESELEFYAGDFDADGKTDLLTPKWYYNSNNPIRYHSRYDLLTNVTSGSSTLMYSHTLPANSSVKSETNKVNTFLTADHNRDGRDDVLMVNTTIDGSMGVFNKVKINYTGSFNPNTGYTNYTASGDYLAPSSSNQPWSSNQQTYNYIHQKWNYLIPGDFDGDGNQDYILILGNIRARILGASEYKAFFNSPGAGTGYWELDNFGFGSNPSPQFYASTVAGADMINTFDTNGDGSSEILVTKDYHSYVISVRKATVGFGYETSVLYSTDQVTKDSRVFAGDFNGDGKGDWLVRNANGTWKILYSTGNGLLSTPFSFNQGVVMNGGTTDHKILVTDFNGDGKSDILHGYPNGPSASKLSMYYSRGAATSFLYEQYDYANKLGLVVVGDFNGDGRSDFLNRNVIWDPADFVGIKSFGKERLLSKITDGHNVTTSFAYKNLTDKTTYPYFYDRTVSLDDPSNLNPYNYVQLPLYAVSSMTMPNGAGGNNTTDFSYENAVVHRQAKGFLGFEKTTANNLGTNVTTVNESVLNTQFGTLYPTKELTSVSSTSQLTRESNITSTFVDLSSYYGGTRFFQRTDKVVTVNHITGSASEVSYTYDNYGNVTTSVSKVGIVAGSSVIASETATVTTSYGTHNTPVPAKPNQITVTKSRGTASTVSSSTQYNYSPDGRLASQVDFNGLPKASTTAYTYNSFGNQASLTLGASGIAPRVTTFTYDPKGRFVLSKQTGSGTAIAQTEVYTVDAKWGKPLTLTTSDCILYSYEYDPFGRLKKTTDPVYTADITYNWDVQGNDLFYVHTDYAGGKPDSKKWFDALGRETKSRLASFGGQWVTSTTIYDARGNISSKTNPHLPSETPLQTTNTYDINNRLQSISNAQKTITFTYSKLSNGNLQVTSVDGSGQTVIKTSDPTGKIVISNDAGGSLAYAYDSYGNQTEVKHGNTILITNTYDQYGRQLTANDKNAGVVTYVYDALGQLEQQIDNAGATYQMSYDELGRLISRQGPEGLTLLEYYENGNCRNNNLVKITGFNNLIKEYTYDGFKRLASEKITIGGTPYITQYSYDSYSNLSKTTYPSGVEVNNFYDNNGQLYLVTGGNAGTQTTLFSGTQMNGLGKFTAYSLANGKSSQITYNHNFPVHYYTQGVQDLSLTFDVSKGNLTSRQDNLKGRMETFQFDALNRLTQSAVNTQAQLALGYDGNSGFSMGNITSKTDAGDYVYRNDKIHAVAYITNPAGSTAPPVTNSQVEQVITYTAFQKVATITELPNSLEFIYGPDYERMQTDAKVNGVFAESRLYLGNYEKQTLASGMTREIHYVKGGDGLCAIIIKENGSSTNSIFVTYKDHLGSILSVTNVNGTVVAEQNFDAWGRRRNANDWSYSNIAAIPEWLYRGYTGHEHLPNFALINMNGRMYDPVQGRMLGPDNYIADPFSTQAYNRYTYALNNPLIYTDPDGNFPVAAVIIGAVIGAYTGGMVANNGQLNPIKWDWNSGRTWTYMLGGAIAGAAGGYLGATVAASQMPLAKFAGYISASFVSSMGLNIVTGGRTPISTSFGVGSYNFTNNEWSLGWGPIEYNLSKSEWNYLFQKGNTAAENASFLFKTALTLYSHRKTLTATDKDKTLAGEALQIASRLTWELPQTLVGMFLYDVFSTFNVGQFTHRGVSYVKSKLMGNQGGMTVGGYSIVDKNASAEIHEFGHTIQSRIFGPLYLPVFAIPSLLRATFLSIFPGNVNYLHFYTESWAEKLGNKYH